MPDVSDEMIQAAKRCLPPPLPFDETIRAAIAAALAVQPAESMDDESDPARWNPSFGAVRLAAGDPGSQHEPRRGSDVETWLKRWRDQISDRPVPAARIAGLVIDDMLDDYRLHADTGTPLDSTEPMGPTIAGVTDDA